MADTFKAYS